MKQWEDKFKENRLFRSPTEICEMYLVPEGETLGTKSGKDYPKMRQFWEKHRLTGDNTKERPYANMQPRLTTKSNVFKVHMIVQTIRKPRALLPTSSILTRINRQGHGADLLSLNAILTQVITRSQITSTTPI